MKLSIIIPIYKVERYLVRCFESCLNQDVDDYEIIAVNDGSPDKSIDIALYYESQYSNIKTLSQKNSGLSAARNTGLDIASGEYVWFVDSDDTIQPHCLKTIYQEFSGNIDILQIQYKYVFEDGTKEMPGKKTMFEGVINGEDAFVDRKIDLTAWSSIYRRDFLIQHQLYFYPGILHEDAEFKPRAILCAKRYKSIDIIAYNYLQRPGSIIHNRGVKNAKDLLFISERNYELVSTHNASIQSAMAEYIACNINWVLIIMGTIPLEDKNQLITYLREHRYLIRFMTKSTILKYVIEGWILFLNIPLGRFLYLLFR